MKKTLLTFLLVTSTLGSIINAQEINLAIDQVLFEWLQKIPVGFEKQYGFENRDEFIIAKTGKPYEVFTLRPSFFTGQVIPDSNYLISAGEWRVPILVNNSYRALLTVIKVNSGWQIVDLGAVSLAKELDEMNRSLDLSDSPSIKIIRIYQLQCDFLTTDNPDLTSGNIYLHPLRSAIINIPELSSLKGNNLALRYLYPMITGNIHIGN
jgi:hypothetical protein